jgi:hypothetical protein
VLAPEVVSPANEFALEGGISAEEAEACVKAIRERFEIASATVASYDPSFDQEGRVLGAGIAHESNYRGGIMTSRIELMLIEGKEHSLPDAVVDDLETAVPGAQRDLLGAIGVTIEAGFADQVPDQDIIYSP